MSARATLTDGATSVALDVHFDTSGLVSSVRAATRSRMVNGALVATPWQRFWSYTVRDGIVFPPEGVFPDLYQLYERTRQVLMAHQERPI